MNKDEIEFTKDLLIKTIKQNLILAQHYLAIIRSVLNKQPNDSELIHLYSSKLNSIIQLEKEYIKILLDEKGTIVDDLEFIRSLYLTKNLHVSNNYRLLNKSELECLLKDAILDRGN